MVYELEHIEKKVREAIVDGTESEQFNFCLPDDVKEAFNSIQLNILTLDSERELKQYVQYHQRVVTMQMNEIMKHMEANPCFRKLGRDVCAELEKILEFLRGNFPKQFSQCSSIPRLYENRIQEGSILEIDEIRTAIQESPINLGLKEMCLNVLTDFVHQVDQQLNFRSVDQLECLLEEFKRINLADRNWPLEEEIRSLFIELNFNSNSIRYHFIQYFKSDLQRVESLTDQIERIAYHLKYVNQVHVRQEFVDNDYDVTLKETLAAWIYEELEFMNRKYQMTIVPGSTKDGLRNDFKIDFDMSVSQVACFIKTLVETGIIRNKNVSELIRFLASCVKTKRSENVSHESFRMKYYNVESNTKDAVKSLFHSAIGQINRN
ncbi:MAG: hypothetical protein R2804_06340 [Cyclobacteriaceae bacterium]